MPTPDEMIAAVNGYVAAFSTGDADAVVTLFAADATVEDPVGSDKHAGHEAIRRFYEASMQTGAKLELQSPIRCAADHAAFAFSAVLDFAGARRCIDVIDVFRFDADGKVAEMRAFWGPGNMNGF